MPSLTITTEDNSPLISYSPEWIPGRSADDFADSYSQSSFTVTNTSGAFASFTFNGTSVEIFGAKRGNHGSYKVKLDNTHYPDFSGHAAPNAFQQSLFKSETLNQGLHQLTLTNLNESLYLDVDFITWEIQIGTEQDKISVNTFQDTDPSFTYLPSEMSWTTNPENLGSFSGGTGHATASSEASCVYTFSVGEGVSLYGPVGPSGSPFGVQLDGGPIMNSTSTKQFYEHQMLLYHTNSLDPGPHQLKLLYQPTAPNQVFAIDYATVFTTSPPHGSGGLTRSTVGTITGVAVAAVLLLVGLSWFFYRRRRRIQNQDLQSKSGVEPYVLQSVSQGFATKSVIPGTIPGPHHDNGEHQLGSKSHVHNEPSQHPSIPPSDPFINAYSPGLNSSTPRTTPPPFPSANGYAEGSEAVSHTFPVPVENEEPPPDYSQAVHANNS